MEKNFSDTPKKKKMAMIAIVLILALVCTGIYAWLYFNRTLTTYAHVEAPSTLAIMGPNQTTMEALDLSNVDLTNTTYKAQIVFCVTGSGTQKYKMELAYTTNVPFTYHIYKTTQTSAKPDESADYDNVCVYESAEGSFYYPYSAGDLQNGTYINAVSGNNNLAIQRGDAGSKHDSAYDSEYSNVQKHAEPLYYLIKGIDAGEPDAATHQFADYYVLELTWDSEIATSYMKETDLVYLLAETDLTQ